MTGTLLNDDIVKQVREFFGGMREAVHVLFFGAQDNCDYCADTRQLLDEIVALSDKLSLSAYDLQADADVAAKYNVDRAPGIIIAAMDGEQVTDYGIRFSGIPSGHEFSTLIQDILLVSGRDSGLTPQAREYLKKLDKPLHLQVFVTPSCPYCPRAVLLAHQMAMENPGLVRAEAVEAMEFPELAEQFNVGGVPQTTINAGAGMVVGAVPEGSLLAEIMRALAK
jgi:glutaredoxin-like protein